MKPINAVTEAVKDAVDIESLLDRFWDETDIRGTVTFCPFHVHHRDTPSFHIRKEGARYYCYSCGVRGDVIEFTRLTYKTKTGKVMPFAQAVRILATFAGLAITKEVDAIKVAAHILRTRPRPKDFVVMRQVRRWANRFIAPTLRAYFTIGGESQRRTHAWLSSELDRIFSSQYERPVSMIQTEVRELDKLSRSLLFDALKANDLQPF